MADKYYGYSPYNYTRNNPIIRIDPNVMQDEPKDKEIKNPLESLLQTWKTMNAMMRDRIFGGSSLSLNEGSSSKENIVGNEINIPQLFTPPEGTYFSASAGKQSSMNDFGLNMGYFRSTDGGFVSFGTDLTISGDPNPSISMSFGYTTNNDLSGPSTGFTVGLLGVGIESYGSTTGLIKCLFSPLHIYTGDYQIGVVFSTSAGWIGVNSGYTTKLK